KLIEDSWMIPYWFLYAYLGFLLTLPLLRRLANAMKEREFQYMILLVVLVGGLLPMVISLILGRDFSFSPYFTIAWVTSGIVCFPLLGHYLENVLDIRKITGFWLCIIWLISIGCLILTCVLTSRKSIETGFISETYVSSLVMVYSLAIYVSFRKLLTSHPLKGKPARFLQVLGSCTFGVYLMHGFLLSHPKLSLVHLITKNEPQLPLIAGFLRCFEIMIPLLFLTWLLKKIPGVRKLL
ncbi:MAG: acyltransferase family protein, partial [Parasporobacterium sp.]|nr:acyltransferase family protein [Parasporobacterium sp.]